MVPVKAVIHQSEAISDTAKGGIKRLSSEKRHAKTCTSQYFITRIILSKYSDFHS